MYIIPSISRYVKYKKNLIAEVYSLLNAVTGSFLAACLDGINPPIRVKITLNTINTIAPVNGNAALIALLPVTE